MLLFACDCRVGIVVAAAAAAAMLGSVNVDGAVRERWRCAAKNQKKESNQEHAAAQKSREKAIPLPATTTKRRYGLVFHDDNDNGVRRAKADIAEEQWHQHLRFPWFTLRRVLCDVWYGTAERHGRRTYFSTSHVQSTVRTVQLDTVVEHSSMYCMCPVSTGTAFSTCEQTLNGKGAVGPWP